MEKLLPNKNFFFSPSFFLFYLVLEPIWVLVAHIAQESLSTSNIYSSEKKQKQQQKQKQKQKQNKKEEEIEREKKGKDKKRGRALTRLRLQI
jgi:hypothetical protein